MGKRIRVFLLIPVLLVGLVVTGFTAVLAMPLQGIFWMLGLNGEFKALSSKAGERIRDRVKAFIESKPRSDYTQAPELAPKSKHQNKKRPKRRN